MKKNGWVRTLGVVLVSAVVLAACGGAGAGGDESSPDFSQIALISVPATSTGGEILSGEGGADPYINAMGIASGFSGLFGVFADWAPDKPASYSYDGFTVEWSQSGNTWCWTITGPEIDFEFCVTDTGSNYQLTVRESGSLLMDGTIAYNGTTGSFTVYGDSVPLFSYAWQPSSLGPYDWRITAEYLSIDSSITIDTTTDGSMGQYFGQDNGDPFGTDTWGS